MEFPIMTLYSLNCFNLKIVRTSLPAAHLKYVEHLHGSYNLVPSFT